MNRDKDGVPDFVLMDPITEDALMTNLRNRYRADKIYTYIGEVVVSVNPYKRLDQLYNDKTINEYKGRQMYEVAPHIYSLSNEVYRNMIQFRENQCVIISGESGAGKTEASKVLMQYIAAVSRSSSEVDRVKNQLLESNPLLEAFGNAKTLRNDNSSRFGKYMEIQFEADGAPAGGKINNYLLEKSRVIIRAKGERNFHIFYQMLSGLPAAELAKMNLTSDPSQYFYLQNSECLKVDTINDKEDFGKVLKAMDIIGIPADVRSGIWSVLAAILLLGNIQFKDGTGTKFKLMVANKDVSAKVANLMKVDSDILDRVLISRSITTGVGKRGSHIVIPLDSEQAIATRDALAKSFYEKLFTWLVGFLNSKLACKTQGVKNVIGVLDIYGFEVFEKNSFEQFCINLCNEKLQQLFIELTLKQEQEEYVKEGIKWEPIKYFNNKIICDLIEGKPVSIISLMDEASMLSESTDNTFMDRITTQFGKHPHFATYRTSQDRTIPDNCFRLKHYAGDVTYNVEGFLEKNKDTLFSDLISCLKTSDSQLVKELYPNTTENTKKRPDSAATQFKNALAALMEKLLAAVPHYIRCIKPNDLKKPNQFDEERVLHQVRYLGLLENIRVRRAGFAYRRLYPAFMWRYKMVCPETWPGGKHTDPKSETEKFFKFFKIGADDFRLGHTKIFIRNPLTMFKFEDERERVMPTIIAKMQAVCRGFMARTKWKERRAAIKIQSNWKGYLERKRWQQRKAAIKIQLFYRKYKAYRWIKNVRDAFGDVRSDLQLGKRVAWPQPPRVLERAQTLLKQIHQVWRAYTMVKSLKDDEPEMRQKVLAYDIFHGKKPWNCSRRYEADYLEVPSNPTHDKYLEGMKNLFAVYGDGQVLFADYVTKVNSHSKGQRRAIVVTEDHIYKQDPKNYKVKKFETPLNAITAIGLSPHDDTWVVISAESPNRDLVLDLGVSGDEKYSEFVSVIVFQMKQKFDREIKVQFADSFNYNTARTPKKPEGTPTQLRFQESQDPKLKKTEFKTGGKTNTVHVVKSPPPVRK
eukprot:TRINITY_DN1423_c0_g2_i1.p1 TRINITY_DN1423_c0_g2~~TRINITY_DN1423_c0_g2_i1.p1  ORF type:complete len:1033 (-),score=362.49 TRINITY_DN1423_c0_g2_i1:84-3182(-)